MTRSTGVSGSRSRGRNTSGPSPGVRRPEATRHAGDGLTRLQRDFVASATGAGYRDQQRTRRPPKRDVASRLWNAREDRRPSGAQAMLSSQGGGPSAV
jgi:hypothetical protein